MVYVRPSTLKCSKDAVAKLEAYDKQVQANTAVLAQKREVVPAKADALENRYNQLES